MIFFIIGKVHFYKRPQRWKRVCGRPHAGVSSVGSGRFDQPPYWPPPPWWASRSSLDSESPHYHHCSRAATVLVSLNTADFVGPTGVVFHCRRTDPPATWPGLFLHARPVHGARHRLPAGEIPSEHQALRTQTGALYREHPKAPDRACPRLYFTQKLWSCRWSLWCSGTYRSSGPSTASTAAWATLSRPTTCSCCHAFSTGACSWTVRSTTTAALWLSWTA